ALERLDTRVPLCILTTRDKGRVNRFIAKHRIVELVCVNDDEVMLDSYKAADVLVMPSTAEAFGMMAIEAMACARPVIVFDGTSPPGTTLAPQMAYWCRPATLLRSLRRSSDWCETPRTAEEGAAGRKLAAQNYDVVCFTTRWADIRRSVAAPAKDRPRWAKFT